MVEWSAFIISQLSEQGKRVLISYVKEEYLHGFLQCTEHGPVRPGEVAGVKGILEKGNWKVDMTTADSYDIGWDSLDERHQEGA